MIGHKPISLMDPAEAAIGSMEVHVNNAGADEMVTLTQIQTFVGVPVTYSLTEQVWPYAKWIGDETIYWRTWQMTASPGINVIPDLTPDVHRIVAVSPVVYGTGLISEGSNVEHCKITASSFPVYVFHITFNENGSEREFTVWYTKP